MFEFIIVMKALACVLITNSHLDEVYPIAAIATGGALGNSLFFLASGFIMVNIREPFKVWITKRFVRIYVPLLIIETITIFISYDSLEPQILFNEFVLPTSYWFLPAYIVFCLFYYMIFSSGLKFKFNLLAPSLIFIYAIIYLTLLDTSVWTVESGYFKWLPYFTIMIAGGYIRNNIAIFNRIKLSTILVIFSTFSIFFVLIKFVMMKYAFLMHFQFTVQLTTFIWAFSIMMILYRMEAIFTHISNKFIMKLCFYLSSRTLEIYLVQRIVIMNFKDHVFPVNFLIITILIICFAEILSYVSNKVQKLIISKI